MHRRKTHRYDALGMSLHWITAIVVVAAFAYGPGGSEEHVYSASRDFDRRLHETLGLLVFGLAILRVVWRAFATTPEQEPGPLWMKRSASGLQFTLYVLLFALPLTAITGAWLEGHPLTLLWGLEIAPRLPTAHASGAVIAEVHTWLGDAILWVAGIHAAASLFHHYILMDGVLESMLPRWLRLRRGMAEERN